VVMPAISEVSASVERIVHLGSRDLESVRQDVSTQVAAPAVDAGAEATSLRTVLREETSIACLSGRAVRMRAKAAGPLAHR
jgi:hypothetical protein